MPRFPVTLSRRQFAWLWLVWLVVGLAMGLQVLAIDRISLGGRQEWWRPLTTQALIYQFWWLLTPVVLALGERYPVERASPLRHWVIHALGGVGVPLVYLSLCQVFVYSHLRVDRPPTKAAEWFLTVGGKIHLEMLTYWVIVGVQQGLRTYRQQQEQATTLAQAEASARDAQLAALKMQLEPHFLFNTLNAISALIHDDPETADALVVRLGDFLRLTLDTAPRQVGRLDEEMAFLERYLSIEAVRFGERLEVRTHVDPRANAAAVPLLFLQPIVENAVRRGIARHEGRGVIDIAATRDAEDGVTISVTNTGPVVGAPTHPGVGLTNTTRRLRGLFGERASLTIRPEQGGGLHVAITFPFQDASGSGGAV